MAEIKSYGNDKWLVRVFIGRSVDGRILRHSKVIKGLKTDAQEYARDIETKLDLGILERPVTAASTYLMALLTWFKRVLKIRFSKANF